MRVQTYLTESLIAENTVRRLFVGKPKKLAASAVLTHLVTVAAKNWHYAKWAGGTPQPISREEFLKRLNDSSVVGIGYIERPVGTPFYSVTLLPSGENLLLTAPEVT